MSIVGYVLLVLGLTSVVAVALYLRTLNTRLTELDAATSDLTQRVQAVQPDLVEYLGEGDRPLLTAELLNPVELAAEQTWVARPMSALTPNLLRDLVYKQARAQVLEQLAAHNIEAEVRVHRAR